MLHSPFWTMVLYIHANAALALLGLTNFVMVVCQLAPRQFAPRLSTVWYGVLFGLACLTLFLVHRWYRIWRRAREADNLLCLVCGYPMRGLTHTNVCPECGETFNAEESRAFFSMAVFAWFRARKRQQWPSEQRWPGGFFTVLWRGRRSRAHHDDSSRTG